MLISRKEKQVLRDNGYCGKRGSFPTLYMFNLCNFVVPTCSVWWVILLPGDGCGSPNHI